jgi:hypothetical protein
MTLRESLLPRIDKIRSIPGRLGVRLFQVYLQTTDILLTGSERAEFGEGTTVTTETLLVNIDGYSPRVRGLTTQEVVASNGLYVDEDISIGPITPLHVDPTGSTTGGFAPDDLDPLQAIGDRLVSIRITGPGYPIGGGKYRVQSREFNGSSMTYSIVARKCGT